MMPQDKRSRLIREWLDDYEQLKHKGNTDAVMWIALKLSISRREAEWAIMDATTPEEEAK